MNRLQQRDMSLYCARVRNRLSPCPLVMAGESSGLTSGLHAPSEGVVKLLALLDVSSEDVADAYPCTELLLANTAA